MNYPKPILTVRSSTDILDVVPTLLGFIPTESLIIIYFDTVDGHERLAVTARMDLPVDPDQRAAARAMAEHHATRHDTLILVAYSADTDAADNALLHLLDTCLKVKVAISASPTLW